MKAKRILETIALVVAIIFVINGASFAKSHKDCEDEVLGCAEESAKDKDVDAEDMEVVDMDAQSMEADSLAASAISSPIPIPTLPICPVYGLCLKSMSPNPANFPRAGGYGYITVRVNPSRAVSATSSNIKKIKIVSYQSLDANHIKITYFVYPYLIGGEGYALFDIGTITIKASGFTTSLKVPVKQWHYYVM